MLQNPNSLTSDIFPRFLFLWHSLSLVFTRSPSSLSLLLPVLYYTCRCQQAPSHRKKAAMWVIQVIDLCVCFNHLTADGNQMSSGRNAFLIILRGHGPAASLLSDKGSISFGVGWCIGNSHWAHWVPGAHSAVWSRKKEWASWPGILGT